MLAHKADFGRYGKSFQEGLVQLIFEDRPFADQITEVLDVELDDGAPWCTMVRGPRAHQTLYGMFPPLSCLLFLTF